MERIEHFAEVSIRRAIGFSMLGIITMVVGLIYDPPLALRMGAYLTALLAVILAVKGLNAPRRPYRRTELWLLLDRRHGLPEERAQTAIGGVLNRLYLRYAERCGYLSAGLWITGFLSSLIR